MSQRRETGNAPWPRPKGLWRFDAELASLRFWRRPARMLVGAWAVIAAAATVTFVLGLGDGLHDYLSARLQAFTPALWVEAAWQPGAAGLESRLEALPGVTAVSKHVAVPVLASAGRASAPARLEGFEPDRIARILPAAPGTVDGRLPSAADEIAAGAVLAAELGVALGSTVRLVSADGRAHTATVVGLIRAGHLTVDGQLLLAPFEAADTLAGPGARRGYALGVQPERDLSRLRLEIQQATGAWVQPWYEGRGSLLAALAVERRVMLWISLAAVVTAAFATASVTALRVMEQRYELAVLRAVGAGFAGTLRTVLMESVAGAAAGAALGAGLGWAASWALAQSPVPLPPEFGLEYIPVSPKWRHAALAVGLAVGSTALAAIVPAAKAAALDPAEILRDA